MNRVDLEEYVTELRQEFAAAYDAQRVACERAVMLMRRLDRAEALLELFADDPLPDVSPPPSPRSLGLVDGPCKEIPGAGSSTVTDYEAVAATVTAAVAERRPVSVALMEKFGITRTHATTLIDRCKSRGLLPRDLRTMYASPRSKSHEQPPDPEPPSAVDPVNQPDGAAEPTASSMEWDLPKRRREPEPTPEVPRRAMPRHGGAMAWA